MNSSPRNSPKNSPNLSEKSLIKPNALKSDILQSLILKSLQEGRSALDVSRKLIGLEIPKQLALLNSNLTHLNLSENQLSSLPDFFSVLTNLTSLDLSLNLFSVIPPSVFKLVQLEELKLNGNEIKSLTGEITALVELEKLSIAKNQLTEVTPRLIELKFLREVDLSYNEIVFLPSEFSGFSRLKILEMKGNPLQFPPKSIAEKGIEAIISFLGDKTTSTISRNEGRYSTVKQSLVNSVKGSNKRRTTVFNLNTFSYASSNESIDAKASKNRLPSITSEHEDLSISMSPTMIANKRRQTEAFIKGHQKQSLGINESLVQDALSNVSVELNSLRVGRKNIHELRNEAQSSAHTAQNDAPGKEVEYLDKQLAYENLLTSCNTKIFSAIQKNELENLMTLSHERNTIRSTYLRDLGTFYNDMLKRVHSSPEDVIKTLDSASKSDQLILTKVSEMVNKSMKKTNDAAKALIQAIEEELAVFDENKEWIKKERILSISKKIAYFDALRMADLTRVPTPAQIASMIKLFIDLSTETDFEVKKNLFQAKVDSRGASKSSILLYELNLGHQLELLSEIEYPEIKSLYPDLLLKLSQSKNSVFMKYRLKDYEEMKPMDSEKKNSVGINIYGVKCLLRRFEYISQEQVDKMKIAVDFLHKNRHHCITSVQGAWFDDSDLYVEEELISGKTLRDWIEKYQNASFSTIRDIIFNVLKGLAYLHRFGFSWGPLNSDSIVIVQDKYDLDIVRPVLCNFDYSFNEQLSESDPPEAQQLGVRTNTTAADMFYFGQLICEILSESHEPSKWKKNHNGQMQFNVPKLSARYASKHLHVLVESLITHDPGKRPNAMVYLNHPYFTVDLDPAQEVSKESRLGRFYLDLFHNRKKNSHLEMFEYDVSLSRLEYVDSIVTVASNMPASELDLNILLMVPSENNLYLDSVELFFKSLTELGGQLMVPIARELPKSHFILPNPDYHDFKKFEAVGRLLRCWCINGYTIPSVFPPVFYKLLQGKTTTLADYEMCFPFDATRRLAVSSTFIQDVEILINHKIVDRRKEQMAAIRVGFFAEPIDMSLRTLSTFELVKVIHGRSNDQLSAEWLKQLTSVEGFELDTATLDFFWMWIDSIEDEELRKFMFYVTGRYSFPENENRECGYPVYLLETASVPIFHLHLSLLADEVSRPFAHHLEIPSCQDYLELQQKVVKSMTTFLIEEDLHIE